MLKEFQYDVKLIVQHNITGALEYVVKSFDMQVEVGEHDFYIPIVVTNDSVKDEMETALYEFASGKGYNLGDLTVITTEIYTNDDTVDISFAENEAPNSYNREPDINVSFIPTTYKPPAPQFFEGKYNPELNGIVWSWEQVKGCAYRMYDHNNNIIAEAGVGIFSIIEDTVTKGENYTRKLVAFDVNGESDYTSYANVYVPEDQVSSTGGITENRFGYADIGEITPALVKRGTIDSFKSGIGDNLDLYTQANTYSAYEEFTFNIIVEGYLINKQKHYTAVPCNYKLVLEGDIANDGPINASASITAIPWPIAKINVLMNSVIYGEYTVKYVYDFLVSFKKERPVPNGGGSLPDIEAGEEKPWFPSMPGPNGDEPFNPGDIPWEQIGGTGSGIPTDNGYEGIEPGDVILEGTLPNGDKIIIDFTVTAPSVFPADPSLDDVVDIGQDGNGGGFGGGAIEPNDIIHDVIEHGCPCLYVYHTCKFKLRLRLKNGKIIDNTQINFVDYDRAIISITRDGVVTGLKVGWTHVQGYYKGGLVHFNVHVLPVNLRISPENPAPIRVGEQIDFCAIKGNYIIPDDELVWSCSSIATVDDKGLLTGEKVGTYKIQAVHRNETVSTTGLIIEPTMRWDFSTSEIINDDKYSLKETHKIRAIVIVNDNIMDNTNLTFRMHDTNIATIDTNGIITGIKIGKTKLDATYKGYTITCEVEVLDYIITVLPNKEYSNTIDFGIKVGKTQQIRVYEDGVEIDASQLKFSSASPNFTVDDNGLVTGENIGEGYINVIYKGVTYKVTGIVLHSELKIYPDNVVVYVNDSVSFDVLLDGEKLYSDVTFSGFDANEIDIADSIAHGKQVGTGVFIAHYKGLTATANYEVIERTTGKQDDTTDYYIIPEVINMRNIVDHQLRYPIASRPYYAEKNNNIEWEVFSDKGELIDTVDGIFRPKYMGVIDTVNRTSDPDTWDTVYHGNYLIRCILKETPNYNERSIYKTVTITPPTLSVSSDAFQDVNVNGTNVRRIVLHMHKPVDNTDDKVKTSTQLKVSYVEHINPLKIRFTSFNNSIVTVSKDGTLTPVRSGITKVRIETLGVKEEVEVEVMDFYRVVRVTGDKDSNEIDVFETLGVRMEKNGVVMSHSSASYNTTSSTVQHNGSGVFEGISAGQFIITVTMDGFERMYTGIVRVPVVHLSLLSTMEPEAISPRTQKPWPDLYKIKKGETGYKVVVNGRTVVPDHKGFVFDVQAYDSICTVVDSSIINFTKSGIARFYIRTHGGNSNTVEAEVGTIRVAHTAADYFPGNNITFRLEDEDGEEVTMKSWSTGSGTSRYYYYNYHLNENPSDDLCGYTTIFTDCSSKTGMIAQGGLRTKMTVIYAPKGEEHLNNLEDYYAIKTFASNDYRPRLYSSAEYNIRGYNNGAVYIDGYKVDAGDNLAIGSDKGNLEVFEQIRTYNDGKRVPFAGYGRKNNLCNYYKISSITNSIDGMHTNDPNFFPNALTETSVVRASGYPVYTTSDARKMIRLVTTYRCSCYQNYTRASKVDMFRKSVGTKITYSMIDNADPALHSYRSGNKTYTCTHHVLRYYSDCTVLVENPDVATVTKSGSSLSITWLQTGCTKVTIMPNDTSSHIPYVFYVHGYVNDEADNRIDTSDNYDIVIRGEKIPMKMNYFGQRVSNKEMGLIPQDTTIGLDENYNAIFNSIGPRTMRFVHKNSYRDHKFHVISSRSPVVDISGNSTMYCGTPYTVSAKIDGYSSILGTTCTYMVTWSSSNTSIATVDKYGRVLAKNEGTVIITAKFLDAVKQMEVTVKPYDKNNSSNSWRIEYISGHSTLFEGETVRLGVKTYAYTTPTNTKYYGWREGNGTASGGSTASFTYHTTGSRTLYCDLSYKCNVTTSSHVNSYHNRLSGYHDTYIYTSISVIKRPEIPIFNIRRNYVALSDNGEVVGYKFKTNGSHTIDIAKLSEPHTFSTAKPKAVDYFTKSKWVRYEGEVKITGGISDSKILDCINAVMSVDEELAALNKNAIQIDDAVQVSCDNTNASMKFNSKDNGLYMTCDDPRYIYTYSKTFSATLDVINNKSCKLLDLTNIVYKNSLGEVYSGTNEPVTTFTYSGNIDLVTVTNDNSDIYPSGCRGMITQLTATLNTPSPVSETVVLNDSNPTDVLYLINLVPDGKVDEYMLEISDVVDFGVIEKHYNKEAEEIIFGGATYVKMKYNSNSAVYVNGLSTPILEPYREETEEFTAYINGREPMRMDGTGLNPFVTITPSFDIQSKNIVNYTIKAVVTESYGKDVDIRFENEITPAVTKVNGDTITITSDEYDMVDVYTKVTCSNTESKLHILDTEFEVSITEDVYNPFFNPKWQNSNIVKTRISAVTNNPNVVVYPVEQEINFKEPPLAGVFKSPYEFKAYILSPSQSCWAPLIHPGYYFLNNNEHFLYKSPNPHGIYAQMDKFNTKEFFAHVKVALESKSNKGDWEHSYKTQFANGACGNTIVSQNSIALEDGYETGTYETSSYSLSAPIDQVTVHVIGQNLEQSKFGISTMTNSSWSSPIEVFNGNNVVFNALAEAIVVNAELNQYKEDGPLDTVALEFPNNMPFGVMGHFNHNFTISADSMVQTNNNDVSIYTSTVIEVPLYKVQNSMLEIVADDIANHADNFEVSYQTSDDGVTFGDWEIVEYGKPFYHDKQYIKFKIFAFIDFEPVIKGLKLHHTYVTMVDKNPVIEDIKLVYTSQDWSFVANIEKEILCSIPMDGEWNPATNRTIGGIIYADLVGSGYSNARIRSIEVNTLDSDIEIEFAQDASTPIMAKSLQVSKDITKSEYIEFDADGVGYLTPIPRLGRPVCVRHEEEYLRHITCYDENGNLTLTNREEFEFNGVMAISLTYHDIDNLVVTYNDEEVPVIKVLNNMVYLDTTFKVDMGGTLVATYNIKNSFYVDYNYDIPNNLSKIKVYIDKDNTSYDRVRVWYETDDERDYYASELEINTLYNTINSGFIYVAEKENVPQTITLYMTDNEFKTSTSQYTYCYALVKDEYDNPVPNVTLEMEALYGSLEIEENVTNKFGVVCIKYLPSVASACKDHLTVWVKDSSIAASQEINIVDATEPYFIVAKPANNIYTAKLGDVIDIDVQVCTDYLTPYKNLSLRIQIDGDDTTNITGVTDAKGCFRFRIPVTINKGLDICRLNISSISVTEYLDIKVV